MSACWWKQNNFFCVWNFALIGFLDQSKSNFGSPFCSKLGPLLVPFLEFWGPLMIWKLCKRLLGSGLFGVQKGQIGSDNCIFGAPWGEVERDPFLTSFALLGLPSPSSEFRSKHQFICSSGSSISVQEQPKRTFQKRPGSGRTRSSYGGTMGQVLVIELRIVCIGMSLVILGVIN